VVPFLKVRQCSKCEFNRVRCDDPNQSFTSRLIEWRGWYGQAGVWRQGLPMLPDALINRIDTAISGVSGSQASPAFATEKHPLQQAESLSCRTRQHLAIGSVAGKAIPIRLEPVPVDVAFVMITYHDPPGFLGNRACGGRDLASGRNLLGRLISAEHVDAGMGRIRQQAKNARVGQAAPKQFAVPRATISATWEA
jgi:hypothetical protein